MQTTDINPEEIDLEQSRRLRPSDHEEEIKDYRAAYERRDYPPPPLLYNVDGKFLCVDGRHRIKAALLAGVNPLACWVRIGTMPQYLAEVFASNAGLGRNNEERRAWVEAALKEYPQANDQMIAQICRVGRTLVGEIRNILKCQARGLIGVCDTEDLKAGPPLCNPLRSISRARQIQKLGILTKTNPVSAKTGPEGQVNFPPDAPVVDMTREQMAEHLGVAERAIRKALLEIGQHAGLLAALAEVRGVRGACQLELPGMPEPVKPRARGTKPEIVAYCLSIGLEAADGEYFWDKMIGSGWKRGNQAVKDWPATVRTWKAQANIFPSQKQALARNKGRPAQDTIAMRDIKAIARRVYRESR